MLHRLTVPLFLEFKWDLMGLIGMKRDGQFKKLLQVEASSKTLFE
jgi:hypothetical protein